MPSIISNITVPLLGLVDVAIVGHIGDGRMYLTNRKSDVAHYQKRAGQLLKRACPLMEIYGPDRNILLDAQVSKVGFQVDMVQYRYEEYCFVFGEETVTFGFLPHSYFCYDGQDYELGESRISAVCDSLHERAAEGTKWYGDDAELLTMFVDNGDEARSVTELFLNTGDACLTGYIEGAYDVLSVEKQPDGYVIRYTYGDFYSHDAIRSSRVTVEDGEMVITDCES